MLRTGQTAAPTYLGDFIQEYTYVSPNGTLFVPPSHNVSSISALSRPSTLYLTGRPLAVVPGPSVAAGHAYQSIQKLQQLFYTAKAPDWNMTHKSDHPQAPSTLLHRTHASGPIQVTEHTLLPLCFVTERDETAELQQEMESILRRRVPVLHHTIHFTSQVEQSSCFFRVTRDENQMFKVCSRIENAWGELFFSGTLTAHVYSPQSLTLKTPLGAEAQQAGTLSQLGQWWSALQLLDCDDFYESLITRLSFISAALGFSLGASAELKFDNSSIAIPTAEETLSAAAQRAMQQAYEKFGNSLAERIMITCSVVVGGTEVFSIYGLPDFLHFNLNYAALSPGNAVSLPNDLIDDWERILRVP